MGFLFWLCLLHIVSTVYFLVEGENMPNLQERITTENERAADELAAEQLALRQGRLSSLHAIMTAERFIGSVWAYGNMGQDLEQAPVLWMPTQYSFSSGWKTIMINEWRAVEGDPKFRHGSGELERRHEIYKPIFETMVMDQTIRLVGLLPDKQFGNL